MRKFEESIKICLLVVDLQVRAFTVSEALLMCVLQPYHFGAFSGMGLCHYRLGHREQAIQAFDQALAINPVPPRQQFFNR